MAIPSELQCRRVTKMKASRRRFLILALLAPNSGIALAAVEQVRHVRIGILGPRRNSSYFPAVLKRLGELGYVQGKNLIVDYRSADGVVERFPALARELVLEKNDLLFAIGPEQSARALIDAKAGSPIILLAIDYDPVKAGLVSSLRRPGGNVTGMMLLTPQLMGKRLELLREILPSAQRFLVFTDAYTLEQLESLRAAADKLHVRLLVEAFGSLPYDFESAFRRGVAAGAEALVILQSPVHTEARVRIFELAMKHRLPSFAPHALHSEAGHLLSYGDNPGTAFSRAGDIAVSILKGMKAGDIPVEQPTTFDLAVNLKTAKALGITIPQTIMVRATRVIQ